MRKKNILTEEQVKERFFARVKKTDSCWEWTGPRTKFGHGFFSFNAKGMAAHRYAWSMVNGAENLIKGFHICHKCNNPWCVNPDHLYQGTPQDNADDCGRAGRRNPNRGEKNHKSNLTVEAVHYILNNAVLGDNVSQGKCMVLFDVSQTTIYEVLKGRVWRHIKRDGD